MQMLIRILANLEDVGVDKEKIFVGVEVDLAQVTVTTYENRTIIWLKIMILAISQLGSRMTFFIDVD